MNQASSEKLSIVAVRFDDCVFYGDWADEPEQGFHFDELNGGAIS
jgi:hypothetical protein